LNDGAYYCSQCGMVIPSGARFCPGCGNALTPPTASSPSLAASAAPTDSSAPSAFTPSDLDAQTLAVLRQKGIIPAIKFYREQSNVALKPAKDYVEALAARNQVQPGRPTQAVVGEKRKGCFSVLLGYVFLSTLFVILTMSFLPQLNFIASPFVCETMLKLGPNKHYLCVDSNGQGKELLWPVFFWSIAAWTCVFLILHILKRIFKTRPPYIPKPPG